MTLWEEPGTLMPISVILPHPGTVLNILLAFQLWGWLAFHGTSR